MTLDEAIKHCEEVADGMTEQGKCTECAAEHRQLAEWLKELKQLREQTKWTPVSDAYPQADDEYKSFLVTDANGEVSIQKFYMTIDKDPQPYFSGMVNVVAWRPLTKPYNAESEE